MVLRWCLHWPMERYVSQSPPPSIGSLLLGFCLPRGRTLTYSKNSTMLVTMPVTISTIPSTQKRPVHEVKST